MFECLIILLVVGSILSLIGGLGRVFFKNYISKKLKNILVTVGVFIAAIAAALLIVLQNQEKKNKDNLQATNGEIKGSKIDHNVKQITVLLGDTKFVFSESSLLEGVNISLTDDVIAFIRIVNGELKISTKVRSLDKKITAQIVDNIWVINPSNYFDRNFNQYGLEIIDTYGIPVLQIYFLSNNVIWINGVFVGEKLITVITLGCISTHYLNYPIDDLIKECENMAVLFKYPSNKYLGQRNIK